MGKSKRYFSGEIKQQAVEDFVSGRRPASEIATELGVATGVIYKWKVRLDEQAKGERIAALEAEGLDPQMARRMQQMEEELVEYQKKVGEQAVIIDLLKKLQPSTSFPRESELRGLIDTMHASGRRRKRVRS